MKIRNIKVDLVKINPKSGSVWKESGKSLEESGKSLEESGKSLKRVRKTDIIKYHNLFHLQWTYVISLMVRKTLVFSMTLNALNLLTGIWTYIQLIESASRCRGHHVPSEEYFLLIRLFFNFFVCIWHNSSCLTSEPFRLDLKC